MLETPHVIVGAAIAYKVTNPALALPLALGSHFILDMVPHWNPHLNTEAKKFGKPTTKSTIIVAVDAVTSLISGFYIASLAQPNTAHSLSILAASFFAVLPDVIEGPYFFLKMKSKIIEKWIKIQTKLQTNISTIPGLLTQIVTITAAFWWIFK